MSHKRSNKPAFTLIEAVVVMLITAMVTVAMASRLVGASQRANFKKHETRLMDIVQQARGLSLTNRLVSLNNGRQFRADYYQVEFHTDQVVLKAVFTKPDGQKENDKLDEFTFDDDIRIFTETGSIVYVYYYPPDGKVCFDTDCTEGEYTEFQRFYLYTEPDYAIFSEIKIDYFGGFLEIERVPGGVAGVSI